MAQAGQIEVKTLLLHKGEEHGKPSKAFMFGSSGPIMNLLSCSWMRTTLAPGFFN